MMTFRNGLDVTLSGTTCSAVRTFGYLASGQVSGDQRTATADYTFAYNNDGRMQTASLNSSGVGSYVYNGFDQRAQKTAGSAVTDFIFDWFGHLLAEANDATGAMLREYIWLDNRPRSPLADTNGLSRRWVAFSPRFEPAAHRQSRALPCRAEMQDRAGGKRVRPDPCANWFCEPSGNPFSEPVPCSLRATGSRKRAGCAATSAASPAARMRA